MSRAVKYIVIDQVNGDQVELTEEDEVYGMYPGDALRERYNLESVPSILGCGGWIEFSTKVRFEPDAEWEEPGEWCSARQRIYALGVVRTMVVYEGEG